MDTVWTPVWTPYGRHKVHPASTRVDTGTIQPHIHRADTVWTTVRTPYGHPYGHRMDSRIDDQNSLFRTYGRRYPYVWRRLSPVWIGRFRMFTRMDVAVRTYEHKHVHMNMQIRTISMSKRMDIYFRTCGRCFIRMDVGVRTSGHGHC
jgi:hypothetical protein